MWNKKGYPCIDVFNYFKTHSYRYISNHSECHLFCPVCFCFHLALVWAWCRPGRFRSLFWGCDVEMVHWCCKERTLLAVYCRPKCLWLERRRWQSWGHSQPDRADEAGVKAANSEPDCDDDGDGDAEGCLGPDAVRDAPSWLRSGMRGLFPQCLSPNMVMGSLDSWNPLFCYCHRVENLRSSVLSCQNWLWTK